MQVAIESIPNVPVGKKGPLIRIRDEDGKNVGRLWIGQANLRWARGRVPEKNAKSISIQDLVEFLDASS